MNIQIEAVDRARHEVRFTSAAGSATGHWADDDLPEVGEEFYVEFWSEPSCVWGVDATFAEPDAPDSLRDDEDGYLFVGLADPSSRLHLADGVLFLAIADGSIMVSVEGIPADAAGRRIRVRQKTLTVYNTHT